MTLELTSAQEIRLQHLAAQTALTPDELLRDGVEQFLEREEEFQQAMKRSDEDIMARRLVEHEEVVSRIGKLLEGR